MILLHSRFFKKGVIQLKTIGKICDAIWYGISYAVGWCHGFVTGIKIGLKEAKERWDELDP